MNLRGHMESLVQDGVMKYGLGLEEVNYAVSFGMTPTPQGVMPAWIILLTARSPLLGAPVLAQMGIMPNVNPSAKDVDDCVLANLDAIRATKAQVMNGTTGENR